MDHLILVWVFTLLLHLTLILMISGRKDTVSIVITFFILLWSLYLFRFNLILVFISCTSLIEKDLALLRSILVNSIIIFNKFTITCVCISLIVGFKLDFRTFTFKSNHRLRPQRNFAFRNYLVCFKQLTFYNIEPFTDIKVLLFSTFAPISMIWRQLKVWNHVWISINIEVVIDVKFDPARLRIFNLFFLPTILVKRVLDHACVKVVWMRI